MIELTENSNLVISCRTSDLPADQCVTSSRSQCRNCDAEVWVSPQSKLRIESGAILLCVFCTKELTEDDEVVFGNNPLTPAGIQLMSLYE
jgi:hypothetical protein